MKKKRKQDDLNFVQAHLGAAPDLPEAIRPENIVQALTGQKQKTPVRKTVRRAVSLAVAACIAISVTVVYRASVYAPHLSADAVTYKEVGTLMAEYHRAEAIRNSFSSFSNFGIRKTADNFYYETDGVSAMDEAAFFGAEENVAAAPASTEKSSAGQTAVSDHAETNTREKNVFEADIIQTDGRYLYLLSGTSFRIVDTLGGMRLTGSLELAPETEGDAEDGVWTDTSVSGFYLYHDCVIFTGTQYTYDHYYGSGKAFVSVYSCADPAQPTLTRSLLFDGNLLSSRLTDGKMIVVTRYYPDTDKVVYNDYSTFIPAVYEGDEADYLPEDCLYLGNAECPECFTSVAVFSPDGGDAQIARSAVFGRGGDIYCTQDTLYVYHATYDSGYYFSKTFSGGVATNILSFDIGGDAPVFKTKGSVPGYLLNTFSLDAYNGYLRAATTYDGKNCVYVLDGDLQVVGQSEALAEGEQIYGVRFAGNTAYVVTFYQTDPLFVLDLTDPTAPTLKGELNLPGFSSYLHPVGEGLLLGLGRGGDENGTDGSAKASLFDVTDPENPREIGAVRIPDAWLHEDYKAFADMGDGTFLIPYVRYLDTVETDGSGIEVYSYEHVSGALRLRVENGTLSLEGSYDVSRENGETPRVSFIGQTVYIAFLESWYSDITLCAFDGASFTQTDTLTLDTEAAYMHAYAYVD